MRYLIIGNSIAAAGAVEGIREEDQSGEITIVGDETHHVYSRPLISYLLQGKTDLERMKYRPDDFYEKNGCKMILGKKAISIDKEKKNVALDDGTILDYDKLLVATGSSPFTPPMTGLDSVPKRFCFMDLDSATALEAELAPYKRVLIIGGGLIGLKCAEGIADRVGEITVVDLAPRILSSILNDEGAHIVQAHLEKQGMKFILGASVSSFEGNTAHMSSGETLEFDILVTAVGVRPNVSLIKDAGGEIGRGITTDTSMKTSLPDIYAAGDCAESFDISVGMNRILAILPNAYRGGRTAGTNMAGGTAEFNKVIPMNAIGFFGLHIITAGSYDGDIYEVSDEESYKKLFYKDDILKGYILIGKVDKAGIYTSLIREQTPLTTIDFDLVKKEPSLVAFSRAYRNEKLGGGAK
ncbi:MAG: NAD(P)/FAD-dependent oxidoreductase [Oscillospiraceae bacterium]